MFRDVRTRRAAASVPAATEADVVRRACLASSAAPESRPGAEVAPHRRDAAMSESVLHLVLPAWPLPPVVRAAARCAAASPGDAWQGQADAPVAVSYPVPRCAAGLSAERTALAMLVLAPALVQPRRAQVQGVVLRPSLRQPVVLRLEALRERSRLGVLHRLQREAVVRPRQRVAAARRQPGFQQARAQRLMVAVEEERPARQPRPRVHAA